MLAVESWNLSTPLLFPITNLEKLTTIQQRAALSCFGNFVAPMVRPIPAHIPNPPRWQILFKYVESTPSIYIYLLLRHHSYVSSLWMYASPQFFRFD